ncbi:MAG TPA: tRNA (adenosine(37)-N6)-threonylcarbamoyltransferase complex dimerization subunit type 1 TsaB [Acidimicrobiales bacterium]|jgi:tRNA threonylcarbamoyladenosine biosynthesis protein TsaB|nr:tRNA (adenosine(37)-N6)-threonylcarbamoyltransferase complex dimerization subunit type 1 TsaB [Acidimicrobiales bacterium]
MNILAIETATTACAIGLATSAGERLDLVLGNDRRHTESLIPGIRDLLVSVGVNAKALDRVVVDRGPGLYTGLRVGIATAVGLALAADCALVGVTSLELLAAGAFRAGVRGTLLAAVDGRRGEVFVQSFELDEAVASTSEPSVARPADVVAQWATRGALTVTGDGATRYGDEFRALSTITILEQSVPPPLEALELAVTREPETSIAPMYLREPDAVANFSTRERSL